MITLFYSETRQVQQRQLPLLFFLPMFRREAQAAGRVTGDEASEIQCKRATLQA
jgi:hypothetical protein